MIEIRIPELRRLIEEQPDTLILDVREPHEYATGHMGGALNVPLERISDHVGSLDFGAPCVCVCATGQRSQQAANFLRMLGYRNAVSLAGGILAWAAEDA